MFHACVVKFDVTKNLEKFLVFGVNWGHSLDDLLVD